MRLKTCCFVIFIMALLSAFFIMGHPNPINAQEVESPLAGAAADEEGYPDGRRWPSAKYEKVKGEVKLQAAEFGVMSASTVGFGAASLIQPQLAEGITLKRSTGVRVMQDVPTARIKGINSRKKSKLMKDTELLEEIDPEQAAELSGEIDTKKPAELLEVLESTETLEKWIINYPIEYKGIPVCKYSCVVAIVGANGELQYIQRRNLPTKVNTTTPTIESEKAVNFARKHAEKIFTDGEPNVGEAYLEVWVDEKLKGHLAWTFTISSDSLTDPKARRYWITAAGEPRILETENLIYHTHFGAMSGTLWQTSPLQATGNRPLQDQEVDRTGAGGGSQVTGEDGRYGFINGTGNATIASTLRGPNCFIVDVAGPVMERLKTGTPVNPVDLNFGASGEFEFAQVTAFYWTNVAYNFGSAILDPVSDVVDLRNLLTRVNIGSSCNAFYSPSEVSINFFRTGGSCPNTAYSDVVLHEWGHGLDHAKGGILDGGLSEGTGDAITILVTRQSCLGRDFSGAGTCLRPATDVILWPPAPGEGVHSIGRRYAGFTWELVQQLANTYSEDDAYLIASQLILSAIAGNPASIPDAVMLSFLADDNDGTLSNGSPHFTELAAAADSRNIPRPPDPLAGRTGYVWANNPTSASYTPSTTYSHNSSGGTITITRSSIGRYAVRFAGLGGSGTAGGHVQVTAYGGGSETAKVANWGSSGTDFIVNVRCFNSSGTPVDTRYTVLVNWY